MASKRLEIIGRHLRGISNAPTAAVTSSFVPQYSSSEHPVLRCRRRVNVLDSYITYLDTGVGDHVLIFIHGNPSSSFLWRNVILQVKGSARCIAPDLIGHGLSGKEPNNQYRLKDHYRYFSAWIEALTDLPEKITIVGHDWGNAVGWYWANQNRHRIHSLVFLEAAMASASGWDKMTDIQQQLYKFMRSPKADEFLSSPDNFVLDQLIQGIGRKLRPDEEAMWRAPFEKPGKSRQPIVTWCREVPVRGDGPDDVIEIFRDFRKWLSEDEIIPKLYIDVEPGMLSPANRIVTRNWKNLTVEKAKGYHFAQEFDPITIGNAIAKFVKHVYSK